MATDVPQTQFATIDQPSSLVLTLSQLDVSCNGGANGSVSANISGGTPGYTYLWTPGGATSAVVNGLSAGSYSVTVTDLNGCQITNAITVNEPVLPLSVSQHGYGCKLFWRK